MSLVEAARHSAAFVKSRRTTMSDERPIQREVLPVPISPDPGW